MLLWSAVRERQKILNGTAGVNHHLCLNLHLIPRPFVNKPVGVSMVRWITFDDQTAAAVVSTVASGTAEIRDGDAFESALHQGDCTLLLPSQTPGQVLFLQVRLRLDPVAESSLAVKPHNTEEPVSYEAGGFLGLVDSPVYEDEAPRPKKWWQKFLD
jgi:hypothetical protein